ncbi:MAG: glycoside hydrolase family 95 protein, partial [Dysgonamonadaceae bacterium]|nr:glycoside hydrolase family 95 protein [Dysgonamonadaceae bacterium]
MRTNQLIFRSLLLLLFACTFPVTIDAGTPSVRKSFSHTYPVEYADWANGFLAGNGKMGVIVFGNPLDETVIFNDRKFFMAASRERSFNKVSANDLQKIREYCAAEQWKEANDLANKVHGWKNGGEGDKHPGYEMLIHIPEGGAVRNYLRECDFRTGEITVKWTDNRGDWERKTFVSRKDNVIVQYLKAPGKGKMDCEIRLDTDPGMHFIPEMKFTNNSDADYLNIRINYAPNTKGAGYEGVTKVITDGEKSVSNGVLNVENARSVLLLTRMEKYYGDCETQWNKKALQAGLELLPTDYKVLLAGQIKTHGAIFDRVQLDWGADAADRALSNEDLLARQKTVDTPLPALWERIFDSGRYLYLSSSSETAAPDLLGLWTGDCRVGWSGYYHLDANLNL